MAVLKKSAFTTLIDFFDDHTGETVLFSEIIIALSERSFGLCLFFLALPNVLLIGSIPGVSTIFGIPVIFISLQMMAGRQYLWVPERLQQKALSADSCRRFIRTAQVPIEWLEKLSKERFIILTTPMAERGVGMFSLLLGIVIALPIPFGNFLGGLCLAIIAIGILEKDGVFIGLGCLMTVAILFLIIFAATHIVMVLWQWFF